MENKDKLGAFYPDLYVEGDLLTNPRAFMSIRYLKWNDFGGKVFTQPVTNGEHLIPLPVRIYCNDKTREDFILHEITL